MRLVVADTGPVNYLILIDKTDVLPPPFDKVIVLDIVHQELLSVAAPMVVRRWVADPPAWLEVLQSPVMDYLPGLHAGETAAIALTVSIQAELLLMDDRRGVRAARSKGFRVTGTLGLLELAARRGLLDFAEAVDRLRRTSFRYPEALLHVMLKRTIEQSRDT